MKKSEQNVLNKYKKLLKQLNSLVKAKKDESDGGEVLRQKMDKLWTIIPENERRKINKNVKLPKPAAIKNPAEKIVENLIKLTTVPIEKSIIKWQINRTFDQYHFKAEYKGKIYTFDGRHFDVYPAGYELPPGIRIGDKSGPDILLSARIDAAPKEFGDLWQAICGQHEKELLEDKRKRDMYIADVESKSKKEQEKATISAKDILGDFKN